MRTLIQGGLVLNEGRTAKADIIIAADRIEAVTPFGKTPRSSYDKVVDAAGCVVMPGVIDTHVHFRQPGMTHKADFTTESRAALAGGVTTVFDMPNTKPATTTLGDLYDKQAMAAAFSRVNYAFLFGATNDNAGLFPALERDIPAIKLFMGSSTGNMLVDDDEALAKVFSTAADCGFPIVAHCEDTTIISRNMREAQERYGQDPPVTMHPLIRSREACLRSSTKAVELARRYGTRLHLAHISTAEELSLLGGNITGEATPAHLLFTDADYARLGARIKCNPAIKTLADREALRRAVADGRIATIATDHAPHLLTEKEGGAAHAMSGMPMVQYSLPLMLTLTDEAWLTLPRLVELMCHTPARLFNISDRGFLRPGYKADITIVRREPWTVTRESVLSRCQWSPLEGRILSWRVEHTFVSGTHAVAAGTINDDTRGELINN